MRNSPTDLAAAVLDIALEMTRERGPAAVSVREVQRRARVSAAAAYRHYEDRAALMLAVGRRAAAELADRLVGATEGVSDPLLRLRAGCMAYIAFAQDEPGLFRAIALSSSPDELMTPHPTALGHGGAGAFTLLGDNLDDYAASRDAVLPRDAATCVWAACHGLAVLLIDSPMGELPSAERSDLAGRHVDLVLAGVLGSDDHAAVDESTAVGRSSQG